MYGNNGILQFSVDVDAHLSSGRCGVVSSVRRGVVQSLVGGANLVKVGEEDVSRELDLSPLWVSETEHST